MSQNKLIAIESFCGAGGMAVGLHRAGFEIPLAFDIDEASIATYQGNIGDAGRLGNARDEPWKSFVAKLAMQPDTTTVPFYFEGRNSVLFQIARKISLTLGYSLMFREICRRMGTNLVVSMRPAIHSSELAEMANRNVVTQFLRRQTYQGNDIMPKVQSSLNLSKSNVS